jgi:hypothetical protein
LFEELLVQERLLKAGDLLRFDGAWGQRYQAKVFRITSAVNTQRIRQIALSAPDVQTVVDLDAIGLNPEHELFAYELRIGVNRGLIKLFARWPSNDFTRQVQDPNFQINPGDVDLKLIGFSDNISSPVEDPRFRMIWIKDQLPSFVALADSGSLAIPMFQKIVLRFIVNILGLEEETDPQILEDAQTGKLFVTAAQHYELIGRRSI